MISEAIEKRARQILARETTYQWTEASEEIREDCRESARAELERRADR